MRLNEIILACAVLAYHVVSGKVMRQACSF